MLRSAGHTIDEISIILLSGWPYEPINPYLPEAQQKQMSKLGANHMLLGACSLMSQGLLGGKLTYYVCHVH
jgi:hypothetical protein